MIAPEDRSSLRLDIDIAQQVGLEAACSWAADFVHWHTLDHRHSGIQYAGPSQGHESEYQAIPAARHALYLQAREKNPSRWSGGTLEFDSSRHFRQVVFNEINHLEAIFTFFCGGTFFQY